MSDTEIRAETARLEQSSLTPAELPMPGSVKDGEKAVDNAFKAHRSRVDAARKAIAHAEKAYTSAVKQARRDREQAARPIKLGSIGVLRVVTLTETTIKTPKGEFRLTPDVQATAEQHGNKQVVQGWVFKSDSDRREVYLHVHGPDWADVVPFSMKHASMQPRHLHEFAAKIGVAARGSDNARAALAARVSAADERLAAALADRGPVESAAESFVAATWDIRELKPAVRNLEQLLDGHDGGDRRTRKASDDLVGVRAKVKDYVAEAEGTRHRVAQETAAVPIPSASAGGPASPAVPVNLTLTAAGPKKIHVIKAVREATGMGLREAKGLVDQLPSVILANADPTVAGRLTAALEIHGATFVVEAAETGVVDVDPVPLAQGADTSRDAPAEAAPEAGPDVFDQIRRLGELRDAGLITAQEFDDKKADLLARL